MKYEILGKSAQLVNVSLDKGEVVYASPKFVYLIDSNKTNVEVKAKGGFKKSFKRKMAGETFKMAVIEAKEDEAKVGFSSEVAGKIIALEVNENKEYFCEAESFVVAQSGVSLDVYVPKKSAEGFLSGDGMVMQKLSGEGMAFIEVDGDAVEMTLAEGEEIKVDTLHVACVESTVVIEGLVFDKKLKKQLTILKGNGKVWLQTSPIITQSKKIKTIMSIRG